MVDWIPGISQIKSLVQVTCGDPKGAERTQWNFLQQCPVVSQGTSAVQAIKGDHKGAKKTQLQCLNTLGGVADAIPVVGHAKGGIHYALGDKDGGDRAMKSSSKTTVVIAAGAVGALAGPGGAAAAGIAAGTAMDGITSGVEYAVSGKYKPEGILKPFEDPKDPGVWVDAALGVVADGLGGRSGSKLVKSGAKLATDGATTSGMTKRVVARQATKKTAKKYVRGSLKEELNGVLPEEHAENIMRGYEVVKGGYKVGQHFNTEINEIADTVASSIEIQEADLLIRHQ